MAIEPIVQKIALDTKVGIFVDLIVDENTGEKYNDYFDALAASRGIGDEQINTAHPHVLLLVAWGKENHIVDTRDMRAVEEFVQSVVNLVDTAHRKYVTRARGEAFILAMIDNMFVKAAELRPEYAGIKIPDEYWNDDKENMRRLENFMPPLPTKNKFHPIERRIGFLVEMMRANPEFAMNLQSIAGRIFNKVVAEAVRDENTDDAGFHDGGLGTGVVAETATEGEVE